jgi:hypothetical protein
VGGHCPKQKHDELSKLINKESVRCPKVLEPRKRGHGLQVSKPRTLRKQGHGLQVSKPRTLRKQGHGLQVSKPMRRLTQQLKPLGISEKTAQQKPKQSLVKTSTTKPIQEIRAAWMNLPTPTATDSFAADLLPVRL